MSDFAQMRAALMGVVETLEASPRAAVSEAWRQAAASFASLVTGSSHALVDEIKNLIAECAEQSELIEGRTEEVRTLVEQYVDNALS